jgi:hypothetical protein
MFWRILSSGTQRGEFRWKSVDVSEDFQLTTTSYIPEDRIPPNHSCENLETYKW